MTSTRKRRHSDTGASSFDFSFPQFSELPAEVGSCSFSPSVELMDYRWRLMLFPGGYNETFKDFVGCYLQCLSAGPVSASFSLSLIIRKNGQAQPEYTLTDTDTFKRKSFLTDDCKSIDGGYGWNDYILRSSLIRKASKLLPNDTLTVRLELSVLSKRSRGANLLSSPLGFVALRDDEQTSDLTIHVALSADANSGVEGSMSSTVLKAHKLVLSAFSEAFKAMFFGPVVMQEAQNNKLVIQDSSMQAVKCMVDFCYSGDIDFQEFSLTDVFEVLTLSCKYQMNALTTVCKSHLLEMISEDNAIEVLRVADSLSLADLKEDVLMFVADNPKCAERDRVDLLRACDKELLIDIVCTLSSAQKSRD